jgi:membrane protein YdbS with pleckstrin-like domain
MGFPRRLLIPDEEVVLDLRPHWVAMVLPAITAIASLIVAIWLRTKVGETGGWIIWAALLIVLVAYPVRRLVWWLTSNFVVTSARVIHREGFIAKYSMEIPLEAINDVRFEQGIIERLLGAGTLVIQSASESGRNTFSFVRDPEEVQKTIYHQSELNQRRLLHGGAPGMGTTVPRTPDTPAPRPEPPGTRAPSVTTELERLADLRARGVLTEEEFQSQKSRVLGQS